MSESGESPGLKAWVLLIILSAIWGSSFILIKKGLDIFTPGEVGALRIFVACLALLPFSIKALKGVDLRQLPSLLFVGCVGSFIPALLFAFAQTRVQSAIAGIGNSFVPIFVIIIGALVFRRKVTMLSTIGIILGFLGCVFVTLGGANFELGAVNLYILFILAATVMYATNVNFIKYYLADIRALHITAVSFLLVLPLCAGYLFLGTNFLVKASANDDFLIGLAYIGTLGAVNTALAMFMFNHLVKLATPVFASSCTYLIPLVSIGWGLLDGELLNAYQFIGVGIILGGVYLANKK